MKIKISFLIYAFFYLFFLSAPAFSQTYEYKLSPGQDTFTDSLYVNQAMGNETGDNWDRLWTGPVINQEAYKDDTGHWVPAIDGTEFTHTYLRFNLGNMTTINDATLRLYRVNDAWGYPNNPDPYHEGQWYKYNDPDKGNITVYYETDNVWNEGTMTWNNEPTMTDPGDNTPGETVFIGPSGGGNWTYPNNGGWFSWNVTSFAQAALNSTDKQLTLMLAQDDTVAPYEPFHIFYSSESTEYPALRPYLGINVHAVPEPISCLLFGIGGLTLAASRARRRKHL
jgi:hypothetical protein